MFRRAAAAGIPHDTEWQLWIRIPDSRRTGHLETVARAISAPESCRSFEMVLASAGVGLSRLGEGRRTGTSHACRCPENLPTCLPVSSRTHVTKNSTSTVQKSDDKEALYWAAGQFFRSRLVYIRGASKPGLVKLGAGQELFCLSCARLVKCRYFASLSIDNFLLRK